MQHLDDNHTFLSSPISPEFCKDASIATMSVTTESNAVRYDSRSHGKNINTSALSYQDTIDLNSHYQQTTAQRSPSYFTVDHHNRANSYFAPASAKSSCEGVSCNSPYSSCCPVTPQYSPLSIPHQQGSSVGKYYYSVGDQQQHTSQYYNRQPAYNSSEPLGGHNMYVSGRSATALPSYSSLSLHHQQQHVHDHQQQSSSRSYNQYHHSHRTSPQVILEGNSYNNTNLDGSFLYQQRKYDRYHRHHQSISPFSHSSEPGCYKDGVRVGGVSHTGMMPGASNMPGMAGNSLMQQTGGNNMVNNMSSSASLCGGSGGGVQPGTSFGGVGAAGMMSRMPTDPINALQNLTAQQSSSMTQPRHIASGHPSGLSYPLVNQGQNSGHIGQQRLRIQTAMPNQLLMHQQVSASPQQIMSVQQAGNPVPGIATAGGSASSSVVVGPGGTSSSYLSAVGVNNVPTQQHVTNVNNNNMSTVIMPNVASTPNVSIRQQNLASIHQPKQLSMGVQRFQEFGILNPNYGSHPGVCGSFMASGVNQYNEGGVVQYPHNRFLGPPHANNDANAYLQYTARNTFNSDPTINAASGINTNNTMLSKGNISSTADASGLMTPSTAAGMLLTRELPSPLMVTSTILHNAAPSQAVTSNSNMATAPGNFGGPNDPITAKLLQLSKQYLDKMASANTPNCGQKYVVLYKMLQDPVSARQKSDITMDLLYKIEEVLKNKYDNPNAAANGNSSTVIGNTSVTLSASNAPVSGTNTVILSANLPGGTQLPNQTKPSGNDGDIGIGIGSSGSTAVGTDLLKYIAKVEQSSSMPLLHEARVRIYKLLRRKRSLHVSAANSSLLMSSVMKSLTSGNTSNSASKRAFSSPLSSVGGEKVIKLEALDSVITKSPSSLSESDSGESDVETDVTAGSSKLGAYNGNNNNTLTTTTTNNNNNNNNMESTMNNNHESSSLWLSQVKNEEFLQYLKDEMDILPPAVRIIITGKTLTVTTEPNADRWCTSLQEDSVVDLEAVSQQYASGESSSTNIETCIHMKAMYEDVKLPHPLPCLRICIAPDYVKFKGVGFYFDSHEATETQDQKTIKSEADADDNGLQFLRIVGQVVNNRFLSLRKSYEPNISLHQLITTWHVGILDAYMKYITTIDSRHGS